MGQNIVNVLKFAIRYPGWHSYATDRSTVDAVNTLAKHDILELSTISRQFRLNETPQF